MADQPPKQSPGGSTSEVNLRAWIKHLKQIDVVKEVKEAAKHRREEEEEFRQRLQEIEDNQKEQEEERLQKREKLKQHLADVLAKQKQMSSYNALSLSEKRTYQALAKWYDNQPDPIPDGILELKFRQGSCTSVNFERIYGEIDSTLKIKKMKGSDKLKEMLLVFKRGKNILLEFYNKDLKENIFTFMFMRGKIERNPHAPEVNRIIKYFQQFHEREQ